MAFLFEILMVGRLSAENFIFFICDDFWFVRFDSETYSVLIVALVEIDSFGNTPGSELIALVQSWSPQNTNKSSNSTKITNCR